MSKSQSEAKYMALGHLARAGATGGTRVAGPCPRARASPCVARSESPALVRLGETRCASGVDGVEPFRGWQPGLDNRAYRSGSSPDRCPLCCPAARLASTTRKGVDMVVDMFEVRIVSFETRESKNGEFVSLRVRQGERTAFVSAFDAGSIDGEAVVLPLLAGGEQRFAAGDIVTIRVRVGAYKNAKGAWASYTLQGVA